MKDRIKKLRKALDLTQQKFADRLGMKQNTIATYEMGRAVPSDPAIKSMCREFGVNEAWLRTGQEPMFAKVPSTAIEELSVDFFLDAFDTALVEEYLHLTPGQRETFRTFFYRVLKKSIGDSAPEELLKAEIGYPEANDIDTIVPPGRSMRTDMETGADEFANLARQQYIEEKRRASQASSASESDVG